MSAQERYPSTVQAGTGVQRQKSLESGQKHAAMMLQQNIGGSR